MPDRTSTSTDGSLPTTFEELCTQVGFPRAIRDEVAYENALELVERLVRLPKKSPGQLEYLDTVAALVSDYEAKTYEEPEGDPLEVLRFLLETHDLSAADLSRLLGDESRSLGTRILSGERQLNRTHLLALCKHFNVSADLFLGL